MKSTSSTTATNWRAGFMRPPPGKADARPRASSEPRPRHGVAHGARDASGNRARERSCTKSNRRAHSLALKPSALPQPERAFLERVDGLVVANPFGAERAALDREL